MLLVPFVENAFKHGDFGGKGFTLKISDENQKLQFYLLILKIEIKRFSFRNWNWQCNKKGWKSLYPKNTNSISLKPKPNIL
jgi:hypothetical protein